MSFNDFFITVDPPGGYPSATPVSLNNATGSALLNSDTLISSHTTILTSSLCRAFNVIGSADNVTRANFFLSSSAVSGQCINVPDTKSISLRIFFRTYSFYGGGMVSLNAKHSQYNTYYNDNFTNNTASKSGYEFACFQGYNFSSGYYFTRFAFNAGGYQSNMTNVSNPTIPEDTYNVYYTPDTGTPWIGLRMDIIPVKASRRLANGNIEISLLKDVVKLYTSNATNPNSWSQIYTTEIPTSDSRFVPWGNYTCLSNGQEAQGRSVLTSSNGFSIRQYSGNSSRDFIDDFKIFVEDAF